MTQSLWCEWAWLGGEAAEPGVVIELDGDRITSVTPGTRSCPPGAVRRDGLTLPGLVNAHSHVFHRALRGRTNRAAGSFWTWREQMYELAALLDPDTMYALARATYGEMALAGITTVGEFNYVHHDADGRRYADPNAMSRAIAAAARGAGVRVTVIDACYLEGGIGRPVEGVQRRFSDGSVDAWADRVAALDASDEVRVAAAIHSVRAVPPLGDGGGRSVGAGALAAVARARERAARRERRVPRGVREDPHAAVARCRRVRLVVHCGARGARHGRGLGGLARGDCVCVPHDRARPRGRHRSERAAARCRVGAGARVGLERGHRSVRRGACSRARRSLGDRLAGHAHRGSAASRGHGWWREVARLGRCRHDRDGSTG